MRIYGDFTERDYTKEVQGVPVASVHKKWVSLRDQIGISITGEVDHRVVIGAVIVIEHIEVTENKNRHKQINFRISLNPNAAVRKLFDYFSNC
jgi:hypothetical protein